MRSLLSAYAAIGELRHIRGATAEEEIGALTDLNAKRGHSSALLFDEIPGYPKGFRVLTGVLDSPRRLALALGMTAQDTPELISRLKGGQIRKWFDSAKQFHWHESPQAPPDFRVFDCRAGEISVESFPTPLWHPSDGGRYIGTACSVLTRDPDNIWVNVGSYRVMVQGPDRVTILFATNSRHGRNHVMSWWERGQPAPIAIVVGGNPVLAALAGVEIPHGVSELDVLGAIHQKPVDVFTSGLTGLPIPADAEVVLEGFLHENETANEGPFGEFTGYYASGAHQAPLARIEKIWMRDDPILLGASPGKPPHDFEYPFGVIRSAVLQDAIEAAGVTDIAGVWTSYCRQWIVVAVRQRHPGHARQAAWLAANCGPGAYFARYIIAVDDDIDPTNTEEVIWAMMTRSDPATDIDIARKMWGSPIDPMGKLFPEGTSYNTRAVIDASIPFTKRDLFPPVVTTDRQRLRELELKWATVLDEPNG